MKSATKAFGEGTLNLGTNRSEQRAFYRAFEQAIFRYGLAVVSVAVALCITLLFEGYTFRTPFFFPAIILSTWVGGAGPGLLAVLLSTLAINYYILEPKFAFTPLSLVDIVHLCAFLMTALLVSSWSAARKRAEQALQRARNEFEAKVEERTAKLSKLNDDLVAEIAERKLAQEQLIETEERLRNVIGNAPIILFALDRSGVLTLSEGKGLETFGVKPAELVGQSVFDLYHASPGLHSHARRALAGEAVTFVTEANNQFFEIHLIPLLDKSGKVAGVNGVTYNITDRRRVERELRLVIDTIPAMAWYTSPDGLNEYCSKAWMEYTGMKSGEELGYGWLEAFHPGDRSGHIAKWRAATEKGEVFESVARIRRADGEYRWFLTQGVPLRDEAGKTVRWYGTNVDIDERKRAESLLGGEKNLLEMIATGVPLSKILNALCSTIEEYRTGTLASVLLLNQDGIHLESVAGPNLPEEWTKQMERLPIGPCAGSCGTAAYRASPVIVSDIATDPLWDVPEHRTSALQYGLRASWSSPIVSSKGKVMGTFCMYYRTPRSPDSDDFGLIERATHLARVAIERDRAEEALRTSQAKYRDLINASPDAISVVDDDGKIVLINPAGVKLAGRSEQALIGSSITDTYLPEERHLLQNRIGRLKSEGSFRFERKFVRKNGEIIPVEVSLSALRGRYYQAIIRDISQRKRAEAFFAGEKRLLEMVAKGDPLPTILDSICRLVEGLSSGALCSILLLDSNGNRLWHGAGPSIPKLYAQAIDGFAIGHSVGSCGSAAYRGEQVIVTDIATDPLWDGFRDIALSNGLRACWSTPIFSLENKVLGTFALYYREPRSPSAREQGLIEQMSHVAGVAIQRKQDEEKLRASEQVARGQVEALIYSLDVLATAPAPDNFLGQMLSTIGRLLDAQSVVLWLLDEANESLLLRAWAEGANFAKADPEHPYIKDPSTWKEDRGLRQMFFAGAPVACEDVEHDPNISNALREYLWAGGTRKFLRIPTLVGGRVRGFIGIRHAARPPYRPEEMELAQALAHQAMLAIQLNELAEQSRQAAVLAERNRMARDIHDTLAQGFTGVILQLEAVADAISSGDQRDAENYLHRASELARRSLNEARRSVHALRPEALRRANFWDALKGIIKNTTAGSAISTKTKLRGKLPELPADWQENLMHIGQEALTNTLKYAHADNFETQLICNAKELRLEFRDDGDGFTTKDGHDGFGLAGMRERVEQMGGELKITSVRGKGTKVAVVLPINGESIS